MPDAIACIASLVKISNKFDHISVGYVQKTAQKQPKIVLSAGMKTFEISKLENYKSDINETCPRSASVNPLHRGCFLLESNFSFKSALSYCNQNCTFLFLAESIIFLHNYIISMFNFFCKILQNPKINPGSTPE